MGEGRAPASFPPPPPAGEGARRRYIANIPGLTPQLLRPVHKPDRPPRWLPRGRTFLTPGGSHALYLAVRALALKKGEEILVPAFVCNSVTRPLEQAGVRIRFFNILENGAIDWGHLERSVDGRVKALLWYHYLGMSYGFDEIVPFCRRRGLYLIEDCAHALFSRYRGRPVGHSGHLSVFSIRKSIPSLYSGALVVNHPGLKVRGYRFYGTPRGAHYAYLRERENYLYRLYLQAEDPTRPVSRKPYRYHAEKLHRFYHRDDRMHRLEQVSLLAMHNSDPDKVSRVRHRNALAYQKRLAGLNPFGPITPGASPIGYPIVIPHRDRLQRFLEKEGVETLIHWYEGLLPREVPGRFPAARKLANSILTLPCHQQMGLADVAYVCRQVERLA